VRVSRPGTRTALLVAVAVVVTACRAADLPDRKADEVAIRALLATNEAATNRRDAEGVADTYLPDGDVWILGFPRVSGLDEIRRNEEEFYRTPGFQSWETRIDTIRFLGSDVALVESSDVTTLDSGEIDARSTWVVSRRNGEWRIAAVRVMVFGERPQP
jgi:uncharacterized protein (TIGR02246 family)